MKVLQLYRLTPIYALLLTVCSYLLVGRISSAHYEPGGTIRAMFVERGPVPYLIVFLTFCTLTMAVLARLRGERRITFMLGMYGLSFLSLIAGVLATFVTFAQSLLQLTAVDILIKNPPVDTTAISPTIQHALDGIGTAADTTHLALLLTLVSWPAVIWCCVSAPSAEHENKGPSS